MKTALKGASLVEALVASVIFLTIFLIATDSLINIARINIDGPSPVEVEEALRDCIRRFEVKPDNGRSYDFDWGVVEVGAKPYRRSDEILDVTITARTWNGRTVIYRYLLCTR
ncbi:MAG: hypothetical protein IJ005_03595 [Bacteroidales bacterium]|nr:hypothetical protein [Bacteroidales bacterium]